MGMGIRSRGVCREGKGAKEGAERGLESFGRGWEVGRVPESLGGALEGLEIASRGYRVGRG